MRVWSEGGGWMRVEDDEGCGVGGGWMRVELVWNEGTPRGKR